ncbi:MAG: efflux RND transporter periplasmic adaptor subunit [Bacteroidetes bacterium]|nr:efflux RND transporter periplasmic adaptor subunit [Bacteroidota bacterium]
MKKYKIIISFLLILVTLLVVSCNGGKKTNTEIKEAEVLPADVVELRADQVKLANIETGLIQMRSLSGNLKVNGSVSVSPDNLATVCMPFGGFVKSANLIPGRAVTKGQTLAIIENQEFVDIQQNFLEAKSKLEYAEAEYKRHTELYKEDVYSQKNLQQVTAEYNSLKAQVHGLEQKLIMIGINPAGFTEDNITSSVAVISPISGYVKSVNVNIGKYVAPTDVLFEIVNIDKLYLELNLFEKDADKVSAGQKIHFFINNETEQHEAVIYQTGRSVNADKTYKVYATVAGNCKNVIPGMYVNAIIEASTDSVTALPAEAIVSFDDKDYIFVFDKNKMEKGNQFSEYRMVEVHKGITDGGYTEIILPGGFDAKSSRIVIKGAYNLLSAMKNSGAMAC